MSLGFPPHIGEELFGDGPPIGLGFGMTFADALSCIFGGFRDASLVASRAISFQFLSWYRERNGRQERMPGHGKCSNENK